MKINTQFESSKEESFSDDSFSESVSKLPVEPVIM